MAILERFGDIIKANINSIIDKMEDPSKMIDQYLRDMMEDFAQVKEATAGVMADEAKAKRQLDDNQAQVAKYTEYAKKALQAGNEGDARIFVAKKQELENLGASLMTTYAAAHENAVKIRQMHDKLASDIETLKTRREMIKAKVAVAKTQETLNDAAASINAAQGAQSAFNRMEEKASKMLDEANAMAELNAQPADKAKALEDKYAADGGPSVDEELDKLKKELGI